MFDEARKMIIEINNLLLQHGYELYDAHYGNIGFRGCHPIYIDFGSIIPQQYCRFNSYELFLRFWVWPFKLLKNKRIDKDFTYTLIKYNKEGISEKQYLKTKCWSGKCIFWFFDWRRRILENIWFERSNKRWIKVVVKICRKLLLIKPENVIEEKKRLYLKHCTMVYSTDIKEGDWTNYHSENVNGVQVRTTKRFDYYLGLVYLLSCEYKISTSFEIGGNAGVFSQLLIEKGVVDSATVSDYDMGAIEAGYKRCKENKSISGKIQFAVIDIMDLMQNTKVLITNRYQSDIVFALAVTHHLILTQKVKLSCIVDLLKKYTKKFIVVEFMPLGIWENDENCQPIPEWYNLEWFLKGLSNEFVVIETYQLSRNRIAVVGEKKDEKAGS